jgi:hypothetical protein
MAALRFLPGAPPCVFGLVILLCSREYGLRRRGARTGKSRSTTATRMKRPSPCSSPAKCCNRIRTDIASPVSDHFYMRCIFSSRRSPPISASRDPANARRHAAQRRGRSRSRRRDEPGRIEFDMRMRERHHLRVDYFKLTAFKQQPLAETSISATSRSRKAITSAPSSTGACSRSPTPIHSSSSSASKRARSRHPHHPSARREAASRARSIARATGGDPSRPSP